MVTELSLRGLKRVDLKIFKDDRGFFMERYNQRRFEELGLPTHFVQDNHSRSIPRVIRGLHFQTSPMQGKLVGCLKGAIWDVAVDLRKDSPTFGKWEAVELSDENGRLLWIPAGFAHGFCVLGNQDADVFYKVDQPYSPQTDGGIYFADPTLHISWPVESPIVSSKDEALPHFDPKIHAF